MHHRTLSMAPTKSRPCNVFAASWLAPLLLSIFTFTPLLAAHPLRDVSHQSTECPLTAHNDNNSSLLANTTSGLFQGALQAPHCDITAWLGIPYAMPPVGDLRFAAPQPYRPASGSNAFDQATVVASAPNVCPQVPYRTLIGTDNHTLPESEDCLTVSVWRSATSSREEKGEEHALLPVLIFIHGGGFTSGGTSSYMGHAMVSQNPDVIFVNFNYRLSILGFPNPGGPSSSLSSLSSSSSTVTPNAGLLDQRLALDWLSANIAAFGGDPNRMTALGQSAGSQSLGHYALAYADDPLVSGMILWSGMPEGSLQDRTGTGWRKALNGTGCGGAEDEVACLRALSVDQLLRDGVSQTLIVDYTNFTDDGWTPGVPSPDNVTNWDPYSGVYIEKTLQGEIANIPTWIQNTMHEADNTSPFNASEPWAWPNGTGAINETASDLSTLVAFQCPAWLGAEARLIGGAALEANDTSNNEDAATPETPQQQQQPTKGTMANVYRSIYNGSFPAMRPYRWMDGRAYHGEDVILLLNDLDTPAAWWGPVTPQMRAAATYLRDAVATFVRDPAHGLQRQLGWRGYGGGGETLQVLFTGNSGPTVDVIDPTAYDAPCREIWKDVLPPLPSPSS